MMNWILRLCAILFIVFIVVPLLISYAAKTLEDVPIAPLSFIAAAIIGGVIGAAVQDGRNRFRAKRKDKSTKEGK